MQVKLLQQWVFVTGTDWLCVLCVRSYSDKRQQQYTQHCGCGDRSSGALMLKRENSTTPPREFCPGNIYQPADSHSGSRAREKLLCLCDCFCKHLTCLLLLQTYCWQPVSLCVSVLVLSTHSLWAIMSWSTKNKHEVNLSVLKIPIFICGHDIIMLHSNVLKWPFFSLQPHEGNKQIHLTKIAHHSYP